ncbi:MAG: hypothetical protein GXO69_02525 [Acidobacteria bacterium]|nr:hypothetical protein [Acidobacteriota bacterium]
MTRIVWNEQEFDLKNLKLEHGTLSGTVNGEAVSLSVVTDENGRIIAAGTTGGRAVPAAAVTDGEYTWVQWRGRTEKITFNRGRDAGAGETGGDGSVKAPMPGKILELMAESGGTVEKDQVLILMESMKLQVEIRSPIDGTVGNCPVSVGDMVDGDALLMEIVPQKEAAEEK